MKFPKLKHPTLCQIILYAPALLFFVVLLVGGVRLPFGYEPGSEYGIVLALSGVLALCYLLRYFLLLLLSDAVFADIRAWKRTRMWYVTNRNGTDRKTAETVLHRRSRRCGRASPPVKSRYQPICLTYRRCFSWTQFWAAIEKIGMVFSVDSLDAQTWSAVTHAAAANVTAMHREPNRGRFPDKKKKKAPVATASVAVILTDHMDAEIVQRVQKRVSCRRGYLLVCVVDFETGRYYFDGKTEYYIQGMTERPEKNYAIGLLKRLAFGGRVPLRGNDHYIPYTGRDYDLEMSVWEYIRTFRETMRESKSEEKRFIKRMYHGQVKLKDEILYCKLGERTASFVAFVDENDAAKIEIQVEHTWTFPRRSRISKKDMAELKSRMEAWLVAAGYQPTFVD